MVITYLISLCEQTQCQVSNHNTLNHGATLSTVWPLNIQMLSNIQSRVESPYNIQCLPQKRGCNCLALVKTGTSLIACSSPRSSFKTLIKSVIVFLSLCNQGTHPVPCFNGFHYLPLVDFTNIPAKRLSLFAVADDSQDDFSEQNHGSTSTTTGTLITETVIYRFSCVPCSVQESRETLWLFGWTAYWIQSFYPGPKAVQPIPPRACQAKSSGVRIDHGRFESRLYLCATPERTHNSRQNQNRRGPWMPDGGPGRIFGCV